jgi:DnaJ family protein A protein 2
MQGLAGPGGPQDGPDAGDLFAQFFGGVPGAGAFSFEFGGPGRPFRKRNKGEDSVIPYEVSLEDLFNGKTVKVNMEKEVECGVCKGCVCAYQPTSFRKLKSRTDQEQRVAQKPRNV